MESTEELIDIVRVWVECDDTILELKEKIKKEKIKKNGITEKLMKMMNDKGFDCLQLNNNSKIQCKKNKVKGAITKKLLLSSLAEFFKEEDELNKVIDHIMAMRSEKVVDQIEKK